MTSQLPPPDGGMDVDDEEQPSQPRERRTPKPQPVVDVGPTDSRMISQLDVGAVRERVGFAVQAMVEDVQGARKDRVWRSFLSELDEDQVQVFFDGGHPMSAEPPLTKPKEEKKKVTLPQVAKLFKQEMLGEDGVFQKGANQPGFWKADGEVSYVEGPRNWSAEYDLLLANSISQALINRLVAGEISVTEVQAMVLKDRILISANEKSAVKELVDTTVAKISDNPPPGVQQAAAKRQQFLKEFSSVAKGKSSESGEESFILMAASSSIYPEQASAMSAMAAILKTDNYVVDGGADAADYLTNSAGKNKIILISAGGFCHAEQNLLVALAKSSYGGPVTVAGGKRPCAVCHVALALVRRYNCTQLRFVERHGGGWFGSSRSSFSKLAQALDIGLETVRAMAQKILPEEQYATAFGSDAPEKKKVTNLRGMVLSKEVATDQLPEPAKVPEGLTKAYDDFVPDPVQVEKEKMEEDAYEIPDDEDTHDPTEVPDLLADDPTPQQLAQLRQDLASLPDESGGMNVDKEED